MTGKLACTAVFVTALLSAVAPVARAHETRPLYIDVEELDDGHLRVRWRAPESVFEANAPRVSLPRPCEARAPETQRGEVHEQRYRCDGPIEGQVVRIRYPVMTPSISTLVHVEWRSGETHTVVAGPGELEPRLPGRETAGGVTVDYLALGVRHILEGYDHLLFLLCLLLIARTWRRVLWTVTGFTVAHSITLALAALDVVRVPVPVVEAGIALSIVFVAAEVARFRHDTLTFRWPVVVSAAFGLLHGFGFASVLAETGLPQTEVPLALLFFNLGVEVGQVAVVLVALALWSLAVRALTAALRAERPATDAALTRFAAYAVGVVAVFWTLERVVAFGA